MDVLKLINATINRLSHNYSIEDIKLVIDMQLEKIYGKNKAQKLNLDITADDVGYYTLEPADEYTAKMIGL